MEDNEKSQSTVVLCWTSRPPTTPCRCVIHLFSIDYCEKPYRNTPFMFP